MTDFQVVEAKRYHCGQLIRTLRREQADGLDRVGIRAHAQLRAMFDASAWKRSWLIDGKLAAMGGIAGATLGSDGSVWIAASSAASSHPVAFSRMVRCQLAEIMRTRNLLVSTVFPEDEASLRFAVFMGFHGVDGDLRPVVSRFGRKDRLRDLKESLDIRVPLGEGYVVAVALRKELAP